MNGCLQDILADTVKYYTATVALKAAFGAGSAEGGAAEPAAATADSEAGKGAEGKEGEEKKQE